MDLSAAGKLLLVVGIGVAVLGALLLVGSRLGLGRLPGDISVSWGNVKVFAPLATCLILSVVLTVVLNLFFRR
ncbi:MAG: DUF2905 domain-containing protein [Acidimicrobiia bacterium]